MDIQALKGMPKEVAIKEAAKYAGVAPEVLDGIWRTESNRGNHATMIGPETKWGTAKGHFQILDNINAKLEKRLGTKLDRFDFYDSLAGAADMMRENMNKFGNERDAVAAYHGGWNKKNWGAKTQDYVAKVLGQAPAIEQPVRPVSAKDVATIQADGDWRLKPSLPHAPVGQSTVAPASIAASRDAMEAAQRKVDSTPFFGSLYNRDSVIGAAYSRTLTPTFHTAMTMYGDDTPDTGWGKELSDNWPTLLKGFTEDERVVLMNTRSRDDYTQEVSRILTTREDTAVLSAAGTGAELTAMLMAGVLDPTTYAAGFATAKAFQVAGYGATALAQAGRKTAAVGAVLAENALGNVVYDAALQAMGEHKSVADYAISAATGLVPGFIQAPFTARAAGLALHSRLTKEALDRQMPYLEQAVRELGEGADKALIQDRARQLETEAIKVERNARLSEAPEGERFNAPDLTENPPVVEAPVANEVASDADALRAEYGANVAPAYENPDYLAARERSLENLESWQNTVKTITDGEYNAATIRELPAGVTVTKKAQGVPALTPAVNAIKDLASEYLPSSRIVIGTNAVRPDANGAVLSSQDFHVIGLAGASPGKALHTGLHELGHAVFHAHARNVPPSILAQVEKDWVAFVADLRAGKLDDATNQRYAATSHGRSSDGLKSSVYGVSRDEFIAEQFVKHIQKRADEGTLKASPGVVKNIIAAVKSAMEYVLGAARKGYIKPGDGAEEMFNWILKNAADSSKKLDDMLPAGQRLDADAVSFSKATPTTPNPHAAFDKEWGLDLLPQLSPQEKAEVAAIRRILQDAEQYVKANPQDLERLKSWADNALINVASPGLLLAKSSHPVAKQVSALMVENTMGASGRKVTAAIRAAQLQREYVGNAKVHYDNHYAAWRNGKVGKAKGLVNDLMSNSLREEFNVAVAREVEARLWKKPLTQDGNIKAAADALEVSYERMRLSQVDAKTVGWGRLPESSYGYMPHKTSAAKMQTWTTSQTRAYRDALREQMMVVEGMDAAFAEKVANAYIDHARVNANAGHEIPASVHNPAAAEYVRQAMQAKGMTKVEIDAFINKLAAGGPNHTKRRLNLDMTKEYIGEDGKAFTMLDMFETDHITLLRNQARRVAGEVGLTGQGIQGSQGLKLLERALQLRKNGMEFDPKVMESFQQVSAEILGRPFGDAAPEWLNGVLTLNATANLGGMGITQIGEYINMAMGIGIADTLKAIGSGPRLIAEVKALARGEKVQNSVLGSMELPDGGGEFGLHGYKMVTRFDNPSSVYDSVGHQNLGTAGRVLRAASHGLSSLSMHRMIQAVQVRGAAEQITQKALRYIRDGVESKALADMGFTPDVVAAMKADLPNMVVFGPNGGVQSFDIRKASDPMKAQAFVSAVHRGAAQLIQDTFVGEIGKWQHTTMGKMLSQFRSFPITAVEKQWGRNRATHGVAAVLGMVVAAAPFAVGIQLARVALASVGRPDQDEYIEKMTSPLALGRAAMNYVGILGLAPDVLDGLSAIMPDTVTEALGDSNRTGGRATIGGIVPIAGYADSVLRAATNPDNPHNWARALPLSNVFWLTPAVNALREEVE